MGRKTHKVTMRRKKYTEEELRYLEVNYPNCDNNELARVLNITIHNVRFRAWKYGWHKSVEYISFIRSRLAKECNNASHINSPESIRKRGETTRRQAATDKSRIRFGLEPKSKRHYRTEPKARLLQRNRLRRLGYVVDEVNLIAYYDENTHRCVRLEAIPRGVKKGYIKPYYSFEPITKKEQQ